MSAKVARIGRILARGALFLIVLKGCINAPIVPLDSHTDGGDAGSGVEAEAGASLAAGGARDQPGGSAGETVNATGQSSGGAGQSSGNGAQTAGASDAPAGASGATATPGGAGQSGAPVGSGGEPDNGDCATRTTVTAPPELSGHGLTYDAERQRVLLLDNTTASSVLYELDVASGHWSLVDAPGELPTARSDPGFAYDYHSRKAVLFGGNAVPGSPRDLWEWDGCRWTNRTPGVLPVDWPSFRWAPGMTYDWASERVIITTGIQNPTFQWETDPADATVYEWDSGNGSFVVRPALGARPKDRGAAVAVGDRNRKLVYLLTGLQEDESPSGGWDTALYIWDGKLGTWTRKTPNPAPAAREFASIYHDLVADRVVVVGGVWYGWLWSPEYWQYDPDGDAFTLVKSADIYNRFWSPIAYADTSNVAIQYGGAEADPVYYGNNVVWVNDDTRELKSGGEIKLLTPQ